MFQKNKISIKILETNAKIPSKSSMGSAGFDLYAIDNSIVPGSHVDEDGKLNIGRSIIHTGIAIQLPVGTVGKSHQGPDYLRNLILKSEPVG